MAKYKLKHKEEGLKLYLEGNSFTDVATIMQERHKFVPPLSKDTIRNWSDAMGWQELMSDVKEEVREAVKEQAVTKHVNRLEEIEEVRGAFLERMREKSGVDIRGHEFAKLTEMQSKLQALNADREDVVEHISKCIEYALDESEMPMKIRQKFLMAYVSRLEDGV